MAPPARSGPGSGRALVDVAAVNGCLSTASFVDGRDGAGRSAVGGSTTQGGELAWWAQEGLRRGGFATLLVVRIGKASQGRAWQAIAVGDSCVFHARKSGAGWQLLRAFPLESAEAFGSHPMLLSSVSPSPSEGIELAGGRLAPGDVLLAATDAVSEWLLADDRRLSFAVEAPIAEVAEAVREARTEPSDGERRRDVHPIRGTAIAMAGPSTDVGPWRPSDVGSCGCGERVLLTAGTRGGRR